MISFIMKILEFFGFYKTPKERQLESKKEQLEEKLEDIENEKNSLDDNVDYLNK